VRTQKVVDQVVVDAKTLFNGPASAWNGQRVKIAQGGADAPDGTTRVRVASPHRLGRLTYEVETGAPLGGQQLTVTTTMRGAGGRAVVYLTGLTSTAPLAESRIVELDGGPTVVRTAEVFPLWETATKVVAVIDLLDVGVEYAIDTVAVTTNGPTPLFPGHRARLGEGGVLCLDFSDRRLDQFTVKVETERGTASLLEFRHSKYAPFVGTAMFDLAPDGGIRALSVYLPFEPAGPLTARLCSPSDGRRPAAGAPPSAVAGPARDVPGGRE
jgi:hypothetical protein